MALTSHRFLKYISLPLGLVIWLSVLTPLHPAVKWMAWISGAILIGLGAAVDGNILLSRNRSRILPELEMETWDVTTDHLHNSNTDLIYFQSRFILVHAVSPYHFGHPECFLVIKASADARNWQELAKIKLPGQDIRDPKLAIIHGRLFLYVLLNVEVDPRPYTTMFTLSDDAQHWAPLSSVGQDGWLFWRPRSLDGKTWYCPAYWHRFNRTAFFKTQNGVDWQMVSTIHEGGMINETCFEFLEDGRVITVGRMEYSKRLFNLIVGHPSCSTLISTAKPPYEQFEPVAETKITRLDGPVLFKHNGRIYAVGRSQPNHGRLTTRPGAVLAKKRTSLYAVTQHGLHFITDLPSAGDTSYPGVVVYNGCAYISYYTSDIRRDMIWLIGMLEPTAIRIAKIDLARLEKAAERIKRNESNLIAQ